MKTHIRSWWVILVAGVLAMTALAIIAFVALEPRQPSNAQGGRPVCSPRPCTELGGWELYVSHVNLNRSRVTLDVTFTNNTPGGALEAVSYRHTNPADFLLHYAGGDNRRPVFDASCPNWDEPRIERGGSAGPDRLCFSAASNGLTGAELQWNPDQGVFPATGTVPLG